MNRLVCGLLLLSVSQVYGENCSGVYRKGSRGDCVKVIQKAASVPADGIFGSQTEAAVKNFQRNHGLTADGVVGKNTWAVIYRNQGGSSGTVSSDDNLRSITAWMKLREGFETRGYQPTEGSGVTIGMGIDLGQQTEAKLRSLGVSSGIIAKVRPYLGLKSRQAVKNAGLNAADLNLSEAEADAITIPFIRESAEVAAEYGSKMNQNGRDTLASLRHWAGSLGNTRYAAKLAVTVNGVVKNFVWNAIKDKKGTTAELKAALQETFKYHRAGTAAYNRIKAEIGHL